MTIEIKAFCRLLHPRLAMRSPITRVNDALAFAGRAERVIRAKDYYRLADGESHRFLESGMYEIGARLLQATEQDYLLLLSSVSEKLAANGVSISLRRLWEVGDLVQTLFDEGGGRHGGGGNLGGVTILYGRVIQAGPRAVKIMWESGLTNRVAQLRQGVQLARDQDDAAQAMTKVEK